MRVTFKKWPTALCVSSMTSVLQLVPPSATCMHAIVHSGTWVSEALLLWQWRKQVSYSVRDLSIIFVPCIQAIYLYFLIESFSYSPSLSLPPFPSPLPPFSFSNHLFVSSLPSPPPSVLQAAKHHDGIFWYLMFLPQSSSFKPAPLSMN